MFQFRFTKLAALVVVVSMPLASLAQNTMTEANNLLDMSAFVTPFDPNAFYAALKNRIWGIDLSHHNPLTPDAPDHIDKWGISFAVLKATEGIDYADPKYDHHYATLSGHDIVLGSYHFYRFNDDPLEQADWFLKNAKKNTFLVVDVEIAGQILGSDLAENVDKFVDHLQRMTGKGVIVYSGANLYQQHLQDLAVDHYVWVAEYQKALTMTDWSLWQFFDNVLLPGVTDPVDGTVFSGDEPAFKAFLDALMPVSKEDG